jgi:hypothetical protein
MKRHIGVNMRIMPFSGDFYELQLMWERARNYRQREIPITPRKGCWLKYQLNLRKITQEAVAQKAGVTQKMVSHFITGREGSKRVKKALAEILRYESFEKLIAAARDKGGVENG